LVVSGGKKPWKWRDTDAVAAAAALPIVGFSPDNRVKPSY
jgi:hypothetical protein